MPPNSGENSKVLCKKEAKNGNGNFFRPSVGISKKILVPPGGPNPTNTACALGSFLKRTGSAGVGSENILAGALLRSCLPSSFYPAFHYPSLHRRQKKKRHKGEREKKGEIFSRSHRRIKCKRSVKGIPKLFLSRPFVKRKRCNEVVDYRHARLRSFIYALYSRNISGLLRALHTCRKV